jgi:hypothetical protein
MAGKKVTAVMISRDDSLRMSVEEAVARELTARGKWRQPTDRFRPSCWRT